MFDDQSVMAESAQNCDGVPGGNAENLSSCGDRQARDLPERRIYLASEMSEASAREKVVALVGQLFFKRRHEIRAGAEEFGRGAGVM